MKPCPICREQPGWALASRYSERQGASFYLLTGCEHATALTSTEITVGAGMTPADSAAFRAAMNGRPIRAVHPVPDADRPAMGAKVEAEFERLFAAKTAKWLPGQVQAFRASLWPAVEPPATAKKPDTIERGPVLTMDRPTPPKPPPTFGYTVKPVPKPKHNLTTPRDMWYQREESDLF